MAEFFSWEFFIFSPVLVTLDSTHAPDRVKIVHRSIRTSTSRSDVYLGNFKLSFLSL